jgi:two-component system OmpR family response regulator
MSVRLLLIDDDARLAELLEGYFGPQGVALVHAGGGQAGLAQLAAGGFDAVLLDVMMPGLDGLSVLRKIRDAGHRVPVIMLTARGDEADRVVGLELGADDYVAKPCELRELVARIRSVLRRAGAAPAPAAPAAAVAEPQRVRFGTKWLDHETQALRDDDGNEHPLTSSEYGLLKAFAANPKRVLSRERLLELANARNAEAFDRAIDIRIMRLRRKIEPDPAHPTVIRTIRGGGYLFTPTGEASGTT